MPCWLLAAPFAGALLALDGAPWYGVVPVGFLAAAVACWAAHAAQRGGEDAVAKTECPTSVLTAVFWAVVAIGLLIGRVYAVEVFAGLFYQMFIMWRLGRLFSPYGGEAGREFWHRVWMTTASVALALAVTLAQFHAGAAIGM